MLQKKPRSSSAKSVTSSGLVASLRKTSKKIGEEGRESILNYIKCIMYTFGDVQEPSDSAAAAVSDALDDQMKLAYRIASTARGLRTSEDSQIEVVDVVVAYRHNFRLLYRVYKKVFGWRNPILRRDPMQVAGAMVCIYKLAPFSRRLLNRSEARRAARDITQPDTGDKVLRELKEALGKFLKDDLEKVAAPDHVDPLYLSRLVKMDQQTQKMDQDEYLCFHKARSTSFVSSASAKRVFQESLKKIRLSNLSSSATELLSTIAYEIVARITEVATQTRGSDERPAPRFCKPKFRNPLLCEGDDTLQQLIPQSKLRRFHQYGLEREDVEKAVQKLIEETAPGSHEIKEMKNVRLF